MLQASEHGRYAKLFNLYLVDGCVPFSKEHKIFKQLAENNPWPKPIGVMGYDDTFVVAGGMGQIASTGQIVMADMIMACIVIPYSHGLNSHGLCSYGLCSSVLCSYGP